MPPVSRLPATAARSDGGTPDGPPCPSADERELAFGLRGPDAQSVTYTADGRTRSERTVGSDGAYLIVLPVHGSRSPGTSFAEPVTAVTYRNGTVCPTRPQPGRPARSCDYEGFVLPKGPVLPTHYNAHVQISVSNGVLQREVSCTRRDHERRHHVCSRGARCRLRVRDDECDHPDRHPQRSGGHAHRRTKRGTKRPQRNLRKANPGAPRPRDPYRRPRHATSPDPTWPANQPKAKSSNASPFPPAHRASPAPSAHP